MLTSDHQLSFGTAGLGGLYAPTSNAAAHDVLAAAWDAGIRYFDTAPHYGNGMAEHRLGDFLRGREGWVLSTKVGRVLSPDPTPPAVINGFHSALPFRQDFDFSHDGILRSVEDSFQRLGLNRIDILYVHDLGDPGAGTETEAHWQQFESSGRKALERLKAEGVVGAVGLGVNTVEACLRLLGQVEMDLILLAGRYTLLDQTAVPELLPRCAALGVKLVIGGVFNSGILATGPVPGAHFNYAPASDEIHARVRRIEAVCAAQGVPLATAALQFPDQHPLVVSTLIGTSKRSSLERNVAQFGAEVPDALWDDLRAEGLIP